MMNTPVPAPISWDAFQALDEASFSVMLGPVAEHAPWVAKRAWAAGPFADRDQLFHAMAGVIMGATEVEQLALLRGHPELAGAEARAGTMTADSQSEQGRLGLMALDAFTVQRIETLNQLYRDRFGFPFIAALRLHGTLVSVLQSFEKRLGNDSTAEHREALLQVCEVMRGRLNQLVLNTPSAAATAATSVPPATTALSGMPS